MTAQNCCFRETDFSDSLNRFLPRGFSAVYVDNHSSRCHGLTLPARNVISERDEIPPGMPYMLILKTLARSGELHGHEIASSIQATSKDVLPRGGRLTLSRAAADADQGLDYSRVGRHERQPPRTLLPNGETRTQATCDWKCYSSTESSARFNACSSRLRKDNHICYGSKSWPDALP